MDIERGAKGNPSSASRPLLLLILLLSGYLFPPIRIEGLAQLPSRIALPWWEEDTDCLLGQLRNHYSYPTIE
jgi:hypothetical protein